MTQHNSSDRSLMLKIRGGDDDAATQLYFKYVRQLHAVTRRQIGGPIAARVEAEDIVQSAFRTLFRRAAEGEYEIPEGQHLWKLLLTIALNKTRNAAAHHRAAKRDAGITTAEPIEHLADSDDLGRHTLEMVIDDMTRDMEASQKQIIEMRIAGAEIDEIARATGRAKRSVERVLQGFRTELAAELGMKLSS